MTGVTLEKVVKRFGDVQVIHGVDLRVEDGEFCVFVGPSGCGKSTLLRMIAGLEETSTGAIRIGARDVTQADPSERGVAMVFQTYALYPHMTVAENMGFGPASPRRCPAASASASPSGAPSCAGQRCSCSTSPCPTSTQNCGLKCGWKSHGSTARSGRR